MVPGDTAVVGRFRGPTGLRPNDRGFGARPELGDSSTVFVHKHEVSSV